MTFKAICAAAIAAAMFAGATGAASAESLAGQVGNKRYAVQFPRGSKDACAKAFAQYVAVNRHAAYAQSPIGGVYTEAFFCSIAGASTTAAAEKQAVDRCNALGKKYKVKTTGRCSVFASK